jgi:hypothetical protein
VAADFGAAVDTLLGGGADRATSGPQGR